MTGAMTAAAASTTMPIGELVARLAKKSQFEDAVAALTQQASTSTAPLEQLVLAALRVHTLLRCRYTTPGFWRAGQQLWRTVLQHHGAQLDEASR
jgi:hypothetical protein